MAAIIDYIPRVTLSNFKELIKRQAETDKTLFSRFTLKNIQYTVMMSIEEQELIFFWEYQGTRNQKRSSSILNQAILETGPCGTFFVLIPVINAANSFWMVRQSQVGMLLAIFTVFRKRADPAAFSMDSDDWNTQYEDTGNSSIEEKQPLMDIKFGHIIRNWKNTTDS